MNRALPGRAIPSSCHPDRARSGPYPSGSNPRRTRVFSHWASADSTFRLRAASSPARSILRSGSGRKGSERALSLRIDWRSACGVLLSVLAKSPVRPGSRDGGPGARIVVAVLLHCPAPAVPCSICRCGDPTFNALGNDGYAFAGWRLALDWERFDKQEGPPAEDAEELVENRVTALASYGFSDRFTIYARVPFIFRSLSQLQGGAPIDHFSTRGPSDPEVHGQLRLWASPLSSLGRRTSASLLAGVKSALGNNDYSREGQRVDEHAQPGTGSTDLFGSLAALQSARRAAGPLRLRAVSPHRGERLRVPLRAHRPPQSRLRTEARRAPGQRGGGELSVRGEGPRGPGEGRNTGGSILYVTPRLLLDLGGRTVLRAAVQGAARP